MQKKVFFLVLLSIFIPFFGVAANWRDYLWNNEFQDGTKIVYDTDGTDKLSTVVNGNNISVHKLSWSNWTWLSSDSFFSWTDFDFKVINNNPVIAFNDLNNGNKLSVYEFDGTNWNALQIWISAWAIINPQLTIDWAQIIVWYTDLTTNKLSVKTYSAWTFNRIWPAENYTEGANFFSINFVWTKKLSFFNDIDVWTTINWLTLWEYTNPNWNFSTAFQPYSSGLVSNIVSETNGNNIYLSYIDVWWNNWIVTKHYDGSDRSVIWSPNDFFAGATPSSIDMKLSWNDIYLAMVDNNQISIAYRPQAWNRAWIWNPLTWLWIIWWNVDMDFEWWDILLSFMENNKSSVLRSTDTLDITPEFFQDFITINDAALNVNLTSNIQIITWITILTETSVSWANCFYSINWWSFINTNQYISSWDSVQLQTISPNSFNDTKICELIIWTITRSWTVNTRLTGTITIDNPATGTTITTTRPNYNGTAYSGDTVIGSLDWTPIFSVIATWWNWSWSQLTDLTAGSHTLIIITNDWNWHTAWTTWSTFIVKTDWVPTITVNSQYTTWTITEITWTIDLTWSDLYLSILWPDGTIVGSTTINNVPNINWSWNWLNLTTTWWYDVIATGVFSTWGNNYTWYDNSIDELLIYSWTNIINDDNDLLFILSPTNWQASIWILQ